MMTIADEKIDDAVHQFAQQYEFRDPDYTPTDAERAMIEDAINGFLSSNERHRSPSPAAKPTGEMVEAAAKRIFECFCGIPVDWAKHSPSDHDGVFSSADWATAIQYARAALEAALSAATPVGEVEWKRLRREALMKAIEIDADDYVGEVDPPKDAAVSLALMASGYSFTVTDDGHIAALVAGDMGYAATDFQIDAETMAALSHPAPQGREEVIEECAKAADEAAKRYAGILPGGAGVAEGIAAAIRSLAPERLPDGVTGAKNAQVDGWIEWKGGECPVAADAYVDVELRCGEAYKGGAGGWSWHHDGADVDIIAYRILPDGEKA